VAETEAMTATQAKRGSYWITTFGCQMNKADSERMAGILREQSRLPGAIKLEMEGLAACGFKEITPLGQNIDAFGRDLPGITPEGPPQPHPHRPAQPRARRPRRLPIVARRAARDQHPLAVMAVATSGLMPRCGEDLRQV
jgi:hypothetical protein